MRKNRGPPRVDNRIQKHKILLKRGPPYGFLYTSRLSGPVALKQEFDLTSYNMYHIQYHGR